MANEITVYGNLAYADADGPADEIVVEGHQSSPASPGKFTRGKQLIATTETVINLGGLTAGWVMLKNLDPTNTVDIKTGASGVIFATLGAAGGFCLLRLGSGVTAPVAVANVAACLIDKLICSV